MLQGILKTSSSDRDYILIHLQFNKKKKTNKNTIAIGLPVSKNLIILSRSIISYFYKLRAGFFIQFKNLSKIYGLSLR